MDPLGNIKGWFLLLLEQRQAMPLSNLIQRLEWLVMKSHDISILWGQLNRCYTTSTRLWQAYRHISRTKVNNSKHENETEGRGTGLDGRTNSWDIDPNSTRPMETEITEESSKFRHCVLASTQQHPAKISTKREGPKLSRGIDFTWRSSSSTYQIHYKDSNIQTHDAPGWTDGQRTTGSGRTRWRTARLNE